MFQNRQGYTATEEELTEGLAAYCYLFQLLMKQDGEVPVSEALESATCIEEWAQEWGTPGEVLHVWRESWKVANQIRDAEPEVGARVEEVCELIVRYRSPDNCVALVNDLVRISEADADVHAAEALFCNRIARLLGVESRFKFERA